MNNILEFLRTRRSTLAANLSLPGPSDSELMDILEVGARVPDHGKLAPWRFIVFKGEQRKEFGNILSEAFIKNYPDALSKNIEFERSRFLRAPIIISVISKVVSPHKVPEWEQQLSSAVVCYNILLAAMAIGYAGQWVTEWYAYDNKVRGALELENEEQIAGFIYLGTAKEAPTERERPNVRKLIKFWEF